MSKIKALLAGIALLALAACGHTPGDRALSGGALGAGAGALGGAVLGGDPLTGALIGGGLGAAGGALTDPRDVDLGRPIWRDRDRPYRDRDYRDHRWKRYDRYERY